MHSAKTNRILKLTARRILDSRNDFTIQTSLQTNNGRFLASVPHGGSRGRFEAVELPAIAAIENVRHRIARQLVGKLLPSQDHLDAQLNQWDGTPTKSNLGANAVLSVSMAACRANAAAHRKPLYSFLHDFSHSKKWVLPVPFVNVLNSGNHAHIQNDFQEYMIVPFKFKSFSSALGAGIAVFHALRKRVHESFSKNEVRMGDEGGLVPLTFRTPEQHFELLENAISDAGFSKKVGLALDSAASQFFKNGSYQLGSKRFSAGQLIDYYKQLSRDFHLVSIEDGLAENDWKNWSKLNKKMGKKIELVGDDLLVSNPVRIQQAIQQKACNALLLKPNQIGTVTETIQACQLAQKAGWKVMVSHRSGETLDSFVADLAVGISATQCKFGAPHPPERMAKYARLLEIERKLGKKARFARDII